MKVIALILLIPACFGYVYDCLDNCECDTSDEVIHCHNGDRTELQLPRGQRLRGFPIIGLTYNKLVSLPDEETLLSKFPDLKVVDVERNPDFDCETLKEFSRVKIVSDCFKNVTEISRVSRIFRPSKECDFACTTQKHYAKLHEYVLNLWEILKEKYNNFDYDQTMTQLREFFIDMTSKINKLGENFSTSMKFPKRIRPDEPRSVNFVTPSSDLEEIEN